MRPLGIHKVTSLRENLQVLTREVTQAEDRVHEKIRGKGNFVVIHEDGDVVAEHGADGEAKVANGTVATERNRLAADTRTKALDVGGDEAGLGGAHDIRRKALVVTDDGVDAGTSRSLRVRRGNDEDDRPHHAADIIKRVETARELGQGLVYGRGVIIDSRLRRVRSPVGWYDDGGIQGHYLRYPVRGAAA